MFFRRRYKKTIAQLKSSHGQIKDENFDFELIEKYFSLLKREGDLFDLSNETWNDLDMGLFFAQIDRTKSKVGQQYLYSKLRAIDYSGEKHAANEQIITKLDQNRESLYGIQYWLQKLNTSHTYHLPNLFLGKHINLPKYFFIIPILSGTMLLSVIFGMFNPSLLIILPLLFPINAAIHYFNKRRVNIYIQSIPLLLTLNKVAKKLAKREELDTLTSNLKRSTRSIDKIKQRISIFKLEQKIESDLEVIYWFLMEIVKITFLLEPLLLFNVVDKLKTKRQDIQNVFEFVGEVDMIQSVISLRSSFDNHCLPVFNKINNELEIENLEHPLIQNCVTNSIQLTSLSCLLTGSNMAGKTTFIRAIGLSYISGLVLNTCFSEVFSMPLMKLTSVIRIEDDISNASSFFFEEVNSMKKIITDCSTELPQLVLLDELFKGTNTKERISSAKAILSYLKHNNCIVFVSTHDIELTELLKDDYALYFFSENVINEKIEFDYKLKKGVPSAGNAIKILELNDYPKSVVKEASSLANNF